MPPPIPGSENLEISRQLLSVLNEMSNILSRHTESYREQAELLRSMSNARGSRGLSESSAQIDELVTSLREGSAESENLQTKAGLLKKAIDMIVFPAEFLNGFKAGLSLSNNLFMSIIRMGGTALGVIKNIGGTILSMPGKIMNFFQNAAGSGTDEYKQALEEVRDAFGNLEVGTSKAVINMTEDMKNFNSVGVSFGRVFGHGRAGMANLLKENAELAKGMGFMFNRMAESLNGNILGLTVLRKATGMSAEAFKSMTLAAEGSGRSVGSMVTEMNIKLAQAEKTFGISTKEIGRDVDAMLKDTATFGRMAPDAMIKTSVYVKKLGISIETLKKVMDKSLNFEDAAQQAASLSEAFNMNIDAMKLMKEQDPSKKLDMIRESFFRTGRSVESLSIAEMKALSNATNLSDEELRLSFSLKNRGMNQAQIAEQMKKGQKNQMTEAEAMQTLAKSIKQLVQSGSALKGSFFDVFMDGFDRGIRRSHEFRRVVRNLQHSMRDVRRAGIEVGHAFVTLFPGIQDILGGLGDLFDPARYRRLMDGVVATFREFFHKLQTQPEEAFREFAISMEAHFLNFFADGSPGSTKFLTGLQKFFKTVGVLMVQGIKFALNGLVAFITGIGKFIANPSVLTQGASETGAGFIGMFRKAVTYVVKEIGPIFVEIIKAITEVIKNLNTKIREILNPAKGGFKGWIKQTFGGGRETESEIFKALKELWPSLKKAFGELFQQLKELGISLLPGALKFIFAYVSPALFSGLFRGVLSQGLTLVLGSLGGISSGFKSFTASIFSANAAIIGLVAVLGILTYGFMTNAKKTAEIGDKIADFVANIGRYIGLGIGYVIKGLGIAIGLIIKFFKDAEFRAKVIGALSSALMEVGNWVLQFLGGIVVGILEALGFKDLAKAFKEQLKFLKDEVKNFTENWQSNFKLVGDFLKDFYNEDIKPFVDKVKEIFNFIVDFIVDVFNHMTDPIKIFFDFIGKGFNLIGDVLSAPSRAIGSFLTYLSSLIDKLPDWLKPDWLKSLGGTLGSVGSSFTNVGNLIKGGFGTIADLFTGASKGVGGFIDVVKQDFIKLGQWFSEHNPFEFIGDAMKSVADVADNIFGHSINTVVAADLKKVNSPADDFKDKLTSSITESFDVVKNIGSQFIGNATKVFDDLVPKIIDSVRSMIGKFLSVFSEIQEAIKKGAITIISNVLENVENIANMIIDTFTRIGLRARKSIETIFPELVPAIKNIQVFVEKLVNDVVELFNVIKTPVMEVFNTVKTVFSEVFKTVTEDLTKIGTWLSTNSPFNLIQKGMNAVQSLAQRIHGHSINTIIAADLRKVNGPAQEMQKNLSSALENGFKNGVQASREHSKEIIDQVKETGNVKNISDMKSQGLPDSGVLTGPMKSIENFARNIKENLFSGVRGLITEYNNFAAEMTSLNNIPSLDMTLERAGENLSANRALRIERGAFNMTVQVNVTLNAGDVTNALYRFTKNNNNGSKPGNLKENSFTPMETP